MKNLICLIKKQINWLENQLLKTWVSSGHHNVVLNLKLVLKPRTRRRLLTQSPDGTIDIKVFSGAIWISEEHAIFTKLRKPQNVLQQWMNYIGVEIMSLYNAVDRASYHWQEIEKFCSFNPPGAVSTEIHSSEAVQVYEQLSVLFTPKEMKRIERLLLKGAMFNYDRLINALYYEKSK